MKLSDEQKNVIQCLLESIKKQQVTTLGGFAGSGKSTVIQHLCHVMKNWSVAAYTGQAAHVLRKKGVTDASTIHSLIYVPEKDAAGNIVLDKYGNPIFILNPNLNAEGVIIDEASMVGKEIFEDLKSFNIPLLFVGDHGQLEPIGSDVHLMKNPDFKLETIHRNAGEIAHFAEFIRKGYRPAAFANKNPKNIFFINRKKAEQKYVEMDQIICGFNKTRVEINKRTRQLLGYETDWPQVGERIMCLRNSKINGLFNGMQGTVGTIFKYHKNKMIFSSDGQDYEIFFDPNQFNKEKHEISMDRNDPHPFDFCHASTAHKVQGSEFDDGMVIEQRCDLWDFKRWGYTAASRFKKRIFWVAS